MRKCLVILILSVLLPGAMAQVSRVVDAWGERYFPEGREAFFVRYLLAMREPSVMAKLPRNVERVARFTLPRSFHAPLTVRITWRKDGVILARGVRLHRSSDFSRPGEIERVETVRLGAASVAPIVTAFAEGDFWKPLNAEEQGILVRDGSQWIFELHDQAGYREFALLTPDAWKHRAEEMIKAGRDPSGLRDVAVYVEVGSAMLDLVKMLPVGGVVLRVQGRTTYIPGTVTVLEALRL